MKNNIFAAVKEIPFPQVAKAFLPQEEVRHGKQPCPFHGPDSRPSFHVYSDGFKCFGCGAQW